MNIYQPILPQGESFSSRVLKTLDEQDARKQRSNELMQETLRTQAATGQLSDMVNKQLNDAIEQASKQRLLGVDQYAVMNQAVPEFYKNKSALVTLQQAHSAEVEALKADEDVEWSPTLAAKLNDKFFTNKDGEELGIGDISSHAAYTSTKGFSLKENYEHLSDSYNKKFADTFGDDVVFDQILAEPGEFHDKTTTKTGKAIEVREGVKNGDELSTRVMAGLIKGSEKNIAMILKEINASRPEGEKITNIDNLTPKQIADAAVGVLDRVSPIQDRTEQTVNQVNFGIFKIDRQEAHSIKMAYTQARLQYKNTLRLQGYATVGKALAQHPEYARLSFKDKRSFISKQFNTTDSAEINAIMAPSDLTAADTNPSNYTPAQKQDADKLQRRYQNTKREIKQMKAGSKTTIGEKRRSMMAYGNKDQLKEAIVSYYNKAINDGIISKYEVNKIAGEAVTKAAEGDYYMIVSPSIGGEDNNAPSITIMDRKELDGLSGSQAIANMSEWQVGESWSGLAIKYLGFDPYANTGAPEPTQYPTPEVTEDQLTPPLDTVYTTENAPGKEFGFK